MKYRIIIVFSLIVLMIVVCIIINRQNRSVPSPDTLTRMAFSGQIYLSCKNDGLFIENSTFLTFLQNNSWGDTPVLVVWFSAQGCDKCVDYAVKKVNKQYASKEGLLPLVFVGADYDNGICLYPYDLLLKRKEYLGLPAEELKTPFTFVYYHGLRHTFFPEERFDELFESYLDSIFERYKHLPQS